MYQPPFRTFNHDGEQQMSTDPPIKKRLHKNHGLLQSSPISINSVKFEEEEQNWRQGSQDWQPIKIESDDEEDLRCYEQLDSKEPEELFIYRGNKRKVATNDSQIQCACKNQNCDTLYCKCMNEGQQCSINCNCRVCLNKGAVRRIRTHSNRNSKRGISCSCRKSKWEILHFIMLMQGMQQQADVSVSKVALNTNNAYIGQQGIFRNDRRQLVGISEFE
ncbi:hypothetical protein pb186bvf_011013 [Paramecium bursaria]